MNDVRLLELRWVTLCFGEADGVALAKNSANWIQVHVDYADEGSRFRAGRRTWVRPDDVDWLGDDLRDLLASLPVVQR